MGTVVRRIKRITQMMTEQSMEEAVVEEDRVRRPISMGKVWRVKLRRTLQTLVRWWRVYRRPVTQRAQGQTVIWVISHYGSCHILTGHPPPPPPPAAARTTTTKLLLNSTQQAAAASS